MSLSEKIEEWEHGSWIEDKHVKEFIKDLKKGIEAELRVANTKDSEIARTIKLLLNAHLNRIDKLAGKELI